jgi:hypothetical protein
METYFKIPQEIPKKNRKLQKLYYTVNISDYLVNLSNFIQIITSVGEAFIDQLDVQLSDNIIKKVYMVALIPDHDDNF